MEPKNLKSKNNNSGFINENVNPNIASLLSEGEKLQKNRGMTKAGRKKVIREQKKSEARKGNRALYDLPKEMIDGIREVAEDNETSNSQIAKLAIWMFLEAVKKDAVDLKAYKRPVSKNPKYNFIIELPEV